MSQNLENMSLDCLAKQFQQIHLSQLFANHPKRFDDYSVNFQNLIYDYSKQRVDEHVLAQLVSLAEQKDLQGWMSRLFSDEAINHTEGRSAMHWALRVPKEDVKVTGLEQTYDDVHLQLDKVQAFAEMIRTGQFRGATGQKITDVVNIGVGGSDLGPLMICRALKYLQDNDKPKVHFASTIDGSQLSQITRELNPESTLFIVSSKSFGTIDTLSNAETAKHWLFSNIAEHDAVMRCHFIGVSANSEKMTQWGIPETHQLKMWQWVGGRYSLWSAIGLPIAVAIGFEQFQKLLAGAHAMDEHFRKTEWTKNIPVLMGLLGVWNNNYLHIGTHAILPYDGRLQFLASYLQQLEMESNGKSIKRDNVTQVDGNTCPIIWGEVGPNAQHAFYQLLHQGTITVASDFILAKRRYTVIPKGEKKESLATLQQQHKLTIANCLAQSRLLAFGNDAVSKPIEDVPLYQQYHGNRPSSTILLPQLDAYYLGALVAMYEHKVFVQAVMWDINPFDQWGVEMGKTIANELAPFIRGEQEASQLDSSTEGLLQEILLVLSSS